MEKNAAAAWKIRGNISRKRSCDSSSGEGLPESNNLGAPLNVRARRVHNECESPRATDVRPTVHPEFGGGDLPWGDDGAALAGRPSENALVRECGLSIQGVESNLQLVSFPWEQGRESTPKYSEADLFMQEEFKKN